MLLVFRNLGVQAGAPTGTVYELRIAGVVRQIRAGWFIAASKNSRATFRFQVVSLDASYRPALDDEVVFVEDGVTIFGGLVSELSEAGLGSQAVVPITTTITASDFNILARRRHVTESLPAGTLKSFLQTIVTYIPGVSLDPSQVDGPTLEPVEWIDTKVEDVLNELSTLTGYGWQVDPLKRLSMFAPGSFAAPFNLTMPNPKAVGDVIVEPTRTQYANRVIVRTSTDRAQADDLAAQATYGIWEMVVSASDTTTGAALQALAEAILAESLTVLKRVRYTTDEKGLRVGQTQTITLPMRNVDDVFTIEELRMRDVGPKLVRREVVATEGLTHRSSWRDKFRSWGGSGTVFGGSASISVQRFAYPLTGDGTQGARSPVPTWVPAVGGSFVLGQSSVIAVISTAARGGTDAVVVARLRTAIAGQSVEARLYNITTGVPCTVTGGTTVVNSTDWQTVVFNVTLMEGTHSYELQVLPSVANDDVYAAGGYVE